MPHLLLCLPLTTFSSALEVPPRCHRTVFHGAFSYSVLSLRPLLLLILNPPVFSSCFFIHPSLPIFVPRQLSITSLLSRLGLCDLFTGTFLTPPGRSGLFLQCTPLPPRDFSHVTQNPLRTHLKYWSLTLDWNSLKTHMVSLISVSPGLSSVSSTKWPPNSCLWNNSVFS